MILQNKLEVHSPPNFAVQICEHCDTMSLCSSKLYVKCLVLICEPGLLNMVVLELVSLFQGVSGKYLQSKIYTKEIERDS